MEIRTRLVNYMKELGDKDLCVAFSGGVDSSVILRAACEAQQLMVKRCTQ